MPVKYPNTPSTPLYVLIVSVAIHPVSFDSTFHSVLGFFFHILVQSAYGRCIYSTCTRQLCRRSLTSYHHVLPIPTRVILGDKSVPTAGDYLRVSRGDTTAWSTAGLGRHRWGKAAVVKRRDTKPAALSSMGDTSQTHPCLVSRPSERSGVRSWRRTGPRKRAAGRRKSGNGVAPT